MAGYTRRPEWLKLRPLSPTALAGMRKITRGLKLHTVCESSRCPNRTDCFAAGTATFMLLGDTCTRNCTFCAVKSGRPSTPAPQEPENIVEAVRCLGLKYVVITSVTRDDLPDGGADHFAQTINAIHRYSAEILVEVLIPDFKGSFAALETVSSAFPAVIDHNIETVPRLYPAVRPQAKYERSLELLKQVKLLNDKILTKSGLMLGLGEYQREIIDVMKDLRQVDCDIITIGQYLQPSLKHHKVVRYVHPDEFFKYQRIGEEMGFTIVSGPLVRSSFHAAEVYNSAASNICIDKVWRDKQTL